MTGPSEQRAWAARNAQTWVPDRLRERDLRATRERVVADIVWCTSS